MRFVISLVVVCVGCVASLPDDPTLTADIAAETARMVIESRAEFTPAPAPPKPDAKCETCLGTGRIGDGRIVKPCPACKGTGKACTSGSCPK